MANPMDAMKHQRNVENVLAEEGVDRAHARGMSYQVCVDAHKAALAELQKGGQSI